MSDCKNLNDQELVLLIKKGDQSAYVEIFQRYNRVLYAHAYKKLRNKEEAQDIVQDVFVGLWTKREELHIKDNLQGYLFSSVRNKFFNLVSHKQVESDYIVSLQSFLKEGATITDFLIRENQFKAIIEREIQSLPPRMRLVFELSRKQHRSHKEIALELGISEETVKDQIKKALRILRPRLSTFIFAIFLANF